MYVVAELGNALLQPMHYGTDVVVHSATKFIGGHGTSIGGVIVDSGNFDYPGSRRFPGFTEPDPSYHGLVFSQLPEDLRPAQYILKARLQYQRDIGPAIAPFNSFLFLQGLQTLSLRMERHCQNALAVANWLEARDEVTGVAYPGLKSSPWYDRAQKYAPNGQGAILAFLTRTFPGRWRYDMAEAFARGASVEDVLVLEDRAGSVEGFLASWHFGSALLGPGAHWYLALGERFGAMGPLGIAESLRGRGLGLALVAAGMAALKERGVEESAIDWTELVDFYGKLGYRVWKSYWRCEDKPLAPG